MKCIENIFYLIFSTESNLNNMCIVSCECPFKLILLAMDGNHGWCQPLYRTWSYFGFVSIEDSAVPYGTRFLQVITIYDSVRNAKGTTQTLYN